ncbi:hypothetical protein TcYC6_0085270 [Trypanosoma cruzi]|nr:hypothetical protein TcYC6_0085270 [Trypanosoma cruzi]
MVWPFALYALELSFRDSSLVLAPGPGGVLNALLRHLVPAARCSLRTMSSASLADGGLRSSWATGDTTRTRRHGKNACRTESCRPLPLLSVVLGVSEGLVHRRLSALLARHRRQPLSTPRRTVSDVVTPVRDKTARGLSERIAVECERRRGGVPRCTVAVAALSQSRLASRLRSTPLTMGDCWPGSAGSRACAVEPNTGCAITWEAAALG